MDREQNRRRIMLQVLGSRYGCCDGVSRRSFLRVGLLGMAGLTLPDALRLRAQAAQSKGGSKKDTAVILIYLGGGPSHMDTYDLKPEAPTEFRGEFKPIQTNVSGVEICELLPKQAKVMDKMAIIRSLHHRNAGHAQGTHWMFTGYEPSRPQLTTNEYPSIGSITAKLRGSNNRQLPAYVSIPNAPTFGNAAYLGAGYNPYGVESRGGAGRFTLQGGLSIDRLEDRRYLLTELDRMRRDADASGVMNGMDAFIQQAYDMITGPAAREAFDLNKESAKTKDLYGTDPLGRNLLLARRLVESGVTFVTVNQGGWDNHGQLARSFQRMLPPYDQAVAALIQDLSSRGLDEKVMVMIYGEFGRTPKVNAGGGRDHWPNSMMAVVAGGGLKMGQAIGATNSKGEFPIDRPISPSDLLATAYHVLGIDPSHQFKNEAGRPISILSGGAPIQELVG